MSLLRVLEVSRSFGGLRALSHVTFDVDQGEIFGLIGPNGAGKTTLFNVITAIYGPSAGRVEFDGHDITGWPAPRVTAAGVARTFQSIHLFSDMSVLQNVMLGQSRFASNGLLSLVPLLADRRESVLKCGALACLESLGLRQFADFPARQLPYAIQRRVEIARALASQPKLLLLDEPAAGLNEEESKALSADIRRIRDGGITIVLIEHDMSVVMEVCERIAVLDFGEKLAEGPPEKIQQDPRVIEAYLGREDESYVAAADRQSFG